MSNSTIMQIKTKAVVTISPMAIKKTHSDPSHVPIPEDWLLYSGEKDKKPNLQKYPVD